MQGLQNCRVSLSEKTFVVFKGGIMHLQTSKTSKIVSRAWSRP